MTLDGHTSGILPVKSEVPQGSVLSPFLFLIYNDDIVWSSYSASMLMFVDDMQILKQIHSLQDCLTLQEDIKSLAR